jgi:excisionase family DNA binding protein
MASTVTLLDAPPLLTVTEVGRLLRFRPPRVRSLVKEGRLACVQVGPNGHLRFRPEDVEAFIEGHRRSAAA